MCSTRRALANVVLRNGEFKTEIRFTQLLSKLVCLNYLPGAPGCTGAQQMPGSAVCIPARSWSADLQLWNLTSTAL